MKKSFFIALVLLIIAVPVLNAVTFKKYSGERAFLLPEETSNWDEIVHEVHRYEIDFPIDGTNQLKATILNSVFGENTSNLNDAAERFLNTFLIEESQSSSKLVNYIPEDGFYTYLSYVSGKLISQTSDLIVYKSGSYLYFAGAARGENAVSHINFYIPSQKTLTIFDLLLRSKEAAISKVVTHNARKVFGYEVENIYVSETFYLSSKGITFVYNPWEIGQGNEVIEITVPKSQLAGCLTPLGEKIIK